MHDIDVYAILGSGALTVLGVTKWLLGREVARVDSKFKDQDRRLDRLEETLPKLVKTDDLIRTEGRIIDAIGEAKQSATAAHDRIDRLQERGHIA